MHAGISLADAVLVNASGIRSVEPEHGSVVDPLEERVAEFAGTQRRHLVGLLRMKNAVEYEKRLLAQIEAVQLVDHARRFARWARERLE